MRKLSTLLVLGLFLWAQTATLWHNAEHGGDHHEHDGKQCELALFAKHSDTTPAIAPAIESIQFTEVSHLPWVAPYIITTWQGRENPTRAPPLFS